MAPLTRALPDDSLFQNPLMNEALPLLLGGGELPLEAYVHQKVALCRVMEISQIECVFDQILIGTSRFFPCNTLQSVEKRPRVDADEAIDADVAHMRISTCHVVVDKAMLLDVLPTRAAIPFLTDLNPNQLPFPAGQFKGAGTRKRQDMLLQSLKVVGALCGCHAFPLVRLPIEAVEEDDPLPSTCVKARNIDQCKNQAAPLRQQAA